MTLTLEEIKEKFSASKSEHVKRSPVYDIQKIPIDQIVSQKTNMNSLTSKSWDALIQSVLNTGYTMNVNVVVNHEYDPSTKGQPIPDLLEVSDGNTTMTDHDGARIGTQVSNDEVAKYFPYRLIDGSHRSLLVRLGKHWFENGYDDSDNWYEGNNIPTTPGKEALAYIAWREDFCVPCAIQDVPREVQISSTILLNEARGSHSLDSMKDIVYNLIVNANMSEDWVARNLYLDVSAIRRMMQLVGFVTPVVTSGEDEMKELSWTPEQDERYIKMERGYHAKQAEKFLINYQKEHPDWEWPTRGDMLELAKSLGYSREKEFKDLAYRYVSHEKVK